MRFLAITILLLSHFGFAQTNESIIAFYNVENLFDTIDDPYKNDFEYLPNSKKKWDGEKYKKKLQSISRVILGINDWQGPDVIGLCEIEKRQVLQDLINYTNLQNFNYGIIHEESDDKRGIDVAMLYKKDRFEILNYKYFKIDIGGRPTRDILYARGVVMKADTIHLFYNHWPSRFGGQSVSEPSRIIAAEFIRGKVDSLNLNFSNPKIVISGDLNDGTDDKSIIEGLKASSELISGKNTLYNTSYSLQHDLKLGSHKYKAEWNLFDQMIVSTSLFDSTSTLNMKPTDSFIYSPTWLQVEDELFFGEKPFRTWAGNNYLGGFSDHFAVYIKLRF